MKYVSLEKNERTAWVAMNRPEAMNSLTAELCAELVEAFAECERDAEIRAVVLTGSGRAFCAGGDLPTLAALKSRDEAEDIVQDVLLKLWGMIGELNPPVEAFACVVTRHAALDRLRAAGTRREQRLTPADDRAVENTADPRAERMFEVMATLPDMQRAVLRMRLAESMEFNEIARLLHTSEQNVRQILSRARKAVMKKYTGK